MDPGIKLVEENPQKKANIFSKLTFIWMIRLFRKGVQQGLQVMDLYKTLDCDKSNMLASRLELNWNKQIEKAKIKKGEPSLMQAISDTYFWEFMKYGMLQFVQYIVLKSFVPVVLGYFIRLFADGNKEEDLEMKMYISGTILVLISFVIIFFTHHTNCGLATTGMRVRISISSLIYRKLLRLNKKSLGQTAAGQMVNLLSNDVNRFDFLSVTLHFLWIAPFQLVIVTYFVWNTVGISSLAGVLAMVLLTLPIQCYLGKFTSVLRSKIAIKTDKRVRLMNEIISGIQVIKMYAWEIPFEGLVATIRAKEIKVLTAAAYLRGVYLSCMVFIERTTLYLTVITYVLLGNVLTADKVFTMSPFFNLLQLALAIYLPMTISIGAETIVSVRRLKTFLMLEEKGDAMVQKSNDKSIIISKVNAIWNSECEHLTLDNINVKIPSGSLCAIIGPVGAGKSSLLQLLLGELPAQAGCVTLGGELSYSSQESWLFASTVRNNILFGQPYNQQLYQRVVKVCALLPDFDQFPQRDQSLVGERGVSLSGGQRARINLARAVYRNADIYLMDDPLSAVDTHVGKHLFEECIVKYLRGKTRVLVTHQLQYLKKADIILVINEGKIEAQGTFNELANSDLDFTKMLVAADETTTDQIEGDERKSSVVSSNSFNGLMEEEIITEAVSNEEEIGLTGASASKEYLKAAGSHFVLFLVILVIFLGQVACSVADYFVSFWTTQEELRHSNDSIIEYKGYVDEVVTVIERAVRSITQTSTNDSLTDYYSYKDIEETTFAPSEFSWATIFEEPIDTNWAIYIYTVIILLIIFLTLIRSVAFFKVCMVASKNLHHKMFHALLKAPMRFFDTNPSGRVLNRFSKDIGAVDEALPRVFMEAMQIMLVMTGILVIIAISNYYMIGAMIVFGIFFLILRNWYIATVKAIKHIEGITKSPVFSHLNSSLNGITTIRASQVETELIREFDSHQDVHTSAWYLTIASVVSYGLWMDFICVLFTATITYSFIILNQNGTISGSDVGLAISQSLILTGMLQHGMRQTAEVVNQMTSVERILHYTTLDKEGPFETPKDISIPKSWPTNGEVKFQKLYLKYAPNNPPVLRDLNIHVESGKKIGIVGRTGAGKSSLITALFRLAPIEGNVDIDGLYTKSIGLKDLRKNISIIPQEPVLFSATLRYNLDPFGEFSDTELWNALEEVELKEAISSLDFMVDEGGSNFSLGQRQLICLARAILRNNKILVLDEATANVDPRTDSLIQTTIRKKFRDCTVLTIAHRLNTIMDSDKVLVMDAGRMIEYDHPYILLQNSNGHFTKMVEQTGPTMTKTLNKISRDAFNETQYKLEKIISPIFEDNEEAVVIDELSKQVSVIHIITEENRDTIAENIFEDNIYLDEESEDEMEAIEKTKGENSGISLEAPKESDNAQGEISLQTVDDTSIDKK